LPIKQDNNYKNQDLEEPKAPPNSFLALGSGLIGLAQMRSLQPTSLAYIACLEAPTAMQ
jgi:hypothetical protein